MSFAVRLIGGCLRRTDFFLPVKKKSEKEKLLKGIFFPGNIPHPSSVSRLAGDGVCHLPPREGRPRGGDERRETGELLARRGIDAHPGFPWGKLARSA